MVSSALMAGPVGIATSLKTALLVSKVWVLTSAILVKLTVVQSTAMRGWTGHLFSLQFQELGERADPV